ncbi:Replication initiator protein A [Rubripirellula lacrimiformis]|uniref:Replication initiator protein A n=1 Tax=Rubripirellula lacrimiformis TaxID=1930273 RepID=A0A517NK11_9BACT|nr:replication initiator protein A [Rubripirellula lacrimiformis]QDT07472.1 Replication initiator protein A [Rubripirellula lacrimiformis]
MNEVSESVKDRSPLLPDRHPTPDLFICDIVDAAPKGDMASMEHPVFSLSTKPDLRVRRYDHNQSWIEIKPSADGLATIHDRDILIYCISQLVAAMNEGRELSQNVRFKGIELLTATNRMTTGRGYDLLRSALERLAGTRISTNILTGDKEIIRGFGLIDSYEIVRETRDGRMQEVEIKLSDWVFNAIRSREVLTLHRDYFRLRRPIERRLYELGRKHCGRQREWRISLDLLRKKCGSGSTLKEFKRLIGKVISDDEKNNHMPDYRIRFDDQSTSRADIVIFESRGSIPAIGKNGGKPVVVPPLDPDTYHAARLAAPGWDVYELERQWRSWLVMSDAEAPRKHDAAFLGFCRKWQSRKQSPANSTPGQSWGSKG